MKSQYIDLLLQSGVLRFGAFQTKSGRQSPYFFNTGNIDSGHRLGAVASIYAELIAERFGDVENLFGPAYKGIPLAVMTAERLAQRLGRDISFTFNRKEAKDHGEGGQIIGRSYQGSEKVVIVEDVITGGTSINETMPLLQKLGVDVVGLVVGVDRKERGNHSSSSALEEVSQRWGIKTASIVNIHEVVEYLYNRKVLDKVWINDQLKSAIDHYRDQYGA